MKRLCKITDVSSDNDFTKLGLVIELIYGRWSPNIVLPMSFLKNLICHRTTHSKKMVNISSQVSQAGSYSYILNWVAKESAFPKFIPSVDIKAMFVTIVNKCSYGSRPNRSRFEKCTVGRATQTKVLVV